MVTFKKIYYNFTKIFIEHNLFSSKSYTTMFKNMPGGLVYFLSYLISKSAQIDDIF